MRGHLLMEAHPSFSSMCTHIQTLKLIQLYVDVCCKNTSIDLSLVSEVWAWGRREHAAFVNPRPSDWGFQQFPFWPFRSMKTPSSYSQYLRALGRKLPKRKRVRTKAMKRRKRKMKKSRSQRVSPCGFSTSLGPGRLRRFSRCSQGRMWEWGRPGFWPWSSVAFLGNPGRGLNLAGAECPV